jgi:hypothetical protein
MPDPQRDGGKVAHDIIPGKFPDHPEVICPVCKGTGMKTAPGTVPDPCPHERRPLSSAT